MNTIWIQLYKSRKEVGGETQNCHELMFIELPVNDIGGNNENNGTEGEKEHQATEHKVDSKTKGRSVRMAGCNLGTLRIYMF